MSSTHSPLACLGYACGTRLSCYRCVIPILALGCHPLLLLPHITCVEGPVAAGSPQATNWLHSVYLPLWLDLWPLKRPVLGKPRAVPLATQPITLGCQPRTRQAPPSPNVRYPIEAHRGKSQYGHSPSAVSEGFPCEGETWGR